jgi:hypothetical protein
MFTTVPITRQRPNATAVSSARGEGGGLFHGFEVELDAKRTGYCDGLKACLLSLFLDYRENQE